MNRTLTLFVAAWLASFASLAAQDLDPSDPTVGTLLWGAVIRGTEVAPSEPTHLVPADLAERLSKSFDFPHFEIIGQHTQPVGKEIHSWVVPSGSLFLRVDYKGEDGDGRSLHLQLWKTEKVILKTDVILRPNSPIFFSEDDLVFVVELKQ